MRVCVYKDRLGQFRWPLKADNNRIIADSGESYANKADCEAGITLVKSTNARTPLVDLAFAAPIQ